MNARRVVPSVVASIVFAILAGALYPGVATAARGLPLVNRAQVRPSHSHKLKVPKVIGKTPGAVDAALQRQRFSLGRWHKLVTHDPELDGIIARQQPRAGAIVKTRYMPVINIWVWNYQPDVKAFSAQVALSDSSSGDPVASLSSSTANGYTAHVSYTVPCDTLDEVLQLDLSTSASSTYLSGDDGIIASWDTHGPSVFGRALKCGSGVVTTSAFDVSMWSCSGTVSFTVYGLTDNQGAETRFRVASVNIPFVDDSSGVCS